MGKKEPKIEMRIRNRRDMADWLTFEARSSIPAMDVYNVSLYNAINDVGGYAIGHIDAEICDVIVY